MSRGCPRTIKIGVVLVPGFLGGANQGVGPRGARFSVETERHGSSRITRYSTSLATVEYKPCKTPTAIQSALLNKRGKIS